MNLIYNSVANFQTLESQDFVREARLGSNLEVWRPGYAEHRIKDADD